MFDKGLTQYAHETSENDKVRGGRVDDLHHCLVKAFSRRVGFVIDDVRGNVFFASAIQAFGGYLITDNGRYFGVELLTIYGIDYCLQITATAGD